MRLLVVRILLDVQFWFPTWLIYLTDRGFTPFQAALADALFHAVILLAELPMGALIDRLGRRPALLATCAGTVVVFAGIGLVSGLWMLLAVWALWGVLWALASGLDTTYAWELAVSTPGAPSPASYLGTTRAVTGVAGVISLLSAGALLEVWAPLPYLVTAGLGAIALLVALGVPGIPREVAEHDPGPTPDPAVSAPAMSTPALTAPALAGPELTGLPALREALRVPAVRAGVLLAAVIATAGVSIRILFQPLGLDLGLGPVAISWCYALFALALGAGGVIGGVLARGARGTWTLLSLLVMACSFVAMGAGADAGLGWLTMAVLMPLGGVAFAVGRTITDVWIVAAVPARVRATVLSLASAASGLAMVGIRPVLVALDTGAAPGTVFIGWGLVCLAACCVCAVAVRHLARPQRRRGRF